MIYIIRIFIFIIGAAIGSFLNVLIDRLPKSQSIMGRSHCDHCRRDLEWYELIPVVSFILQKGKSRCCHKKISWQYPMVEIITGMAFILISNFQFPIFNPQTVVLLGIVSCLIVIFFSDLKYQIIPDSIQIVLLILSFVFLVLNSTRLAEVLAKRELLILNSIFSGIIVMSPILILYLVTRGGGMGFADVKLAFIMGVLLGTVGGLTALYLSFVLGAVVGLVLIAFGKKKFKSKIAFGPFLVIGITALIFFMPYIDEMIKKIYGF